MIPVALVSIHSIRAPPDAAMDEAEFGLALRPNRSSDGCGTRIRLRSSIRRGTRGRFICAGVIGSESIPNVIWGRFPSHSRRHAQLERHTIMRGAKVMATDNAQS